MMAELDEDLYSLPRIIFRKRWAPLRLSGNEVSKHAFGGPLSCQISGWPDGCPLPQRVASIDLADPAISVKAKWNRLSLVYAYRVDGCELEYELAGHDQLRLRKLSGKPEPNWPYSGYPSEFPVRRLELGAYSPLHWKCDDESEACDEGHVWSVIDEDPPERDELYIIIPPNENYGVSLWGFEGDRERVETIFKVNIRQATVNAWNACT